MKPPLIGIRILALSQFGAGPYGMMLLADLGADVIKIEDPTTGGDVSRTVPPDAADGDGLYFQSFNRNNRSLTLNLRHPDGMAVLHDLVRGADAIFSNLRGDQPDKLGIRYEHLRHHNPAIVCCALTGFGMTGPRRDEPGYDYLIQAYAGFMSLTGEPDGPPARAGVSVVDFASGMAAALGLVSAVLDAQRTGIGRDVDVSLLDTAASMLNYVAAWTLNSDVRISRLPNSSHPTLYPSQVFATADGYLAIMCAKEKFWQELVARIGLPDLAHDPRFRTFADRYRHPAELNDVLSERFRAESTATWLDRLRGAVPCAPVNSVEEALNDEQLLARNMIVTIDHPALGPIRLPGNPIQMPGAEPPLRPAPRLGEDTDLILAEDLSYSPERIAQLRAARII